jgi:putative ABC transport system permease protein
MSQSLSDLRLRSLFGNLRYALRMFRNMPGLTVTILLSLGIGIGSLTAAFTLGYIVILTPLPYPEPGQLMVVWSNVKNGHNSVATADFMDWKRESHSFEQMTAQADSAFNIANGDQPESIQGMRVTPGYYNELGGPASLQFGRDFLPEEGVAGKDQVVILSNRLWQRLGGNPKMLGSSMSVDGQPHTVVGITRGGILDEEGPEIAVPLVFTPDQINHDFHWLRVLGRLRPGVTQEQAQTDMDAVSAGIARVNPKSNQGWGVALVPLQKDSMPEKAKTAFWLLIGAVGFVLLMICVNVGNLLLARGMVRQKEIGIRTALGASRRTIFAQMLTESLTLAFAGGALGVALDFALLRFMAYKAPDFAPREAQAGPHVNLIALLFTLGATTLCGLLFGYAPAWFAARVNPIDSLKEGHAGTSAGRQRLRRVLICGEFALALSLLTGAGLAVHSFSNRIHANLGLRTDHILTFLMPVPESRPKDPRTIAAYYQKIVGSIQTVPGVSSVAITTGNPLFGSAFGMPFTITGQPVPNDLSQRPSTHFDIVTPEYFDTFGIPIARGRAFNAQDIASGVRVAVVNEYFAQKYLAGADPLTQSISMEQLIPGVTKLGPAVDWQIVGVMCNARGVTKEDSPTMLIPFAQTPWPATTIAVRTATDPAQMGKSIAAAIRTVDSVIALRQLETMDQLRKEAMLGDRNIMIACMTFATAALLLAMIGIYGVMSFAVVQRSNEISLRIALGADRARIVSMIMKEGALLAVVGLAIGLVGAIFIERGMQGLLFDVAKIDYLVLVAVSAILLLAALVACLLPAKRAAAADPMHALKSQ